MNRVGSREVGEVEKALDVVATVAGELTAFLRIDRVDSLARCTELIDRLPAPQRAALLPLISKFHYSAYCTDHVLASHLLGLGDWSEAGVMKSPPPAEKIEAFRKIWLPLARQLSGIEAFARVMYGHHVLGALQALVGPALPMRRTALPPLGDIRSRSAERPLKMRLSVRDPRSGSS